MTPEEKEELLVALCGYLPYGVNVSYKDSKGKFCRATVEAVGHSATNCNIHDNLYHDDLSVLPFDKDYIYENPKTAETYVCTDEVQIFLRPMSSMTEEELYQLKELGGSIIFYNTEKKIHGQYIHMALKYMTGLIKRCLTIVDSLRKVLH